MYCHISPTLNNEKERDIEVEQKDKKIAKGSKSMILDLRSSKKEVDKVRERKDKVTVAQDRWTK